MSRITRNTAALVFLVSTWMALGASQTFALYRSTDDGRSWSPVGQGLPSDLRVDALIASGNQRLAGTERGLFVSSDDGANWRRPAQGVPETLKVFAFAQLADRVYAATSQGVWSSAEDGQSWSPVGTELAGKRVLSLFADHDRLFAGTDREGVHALVKERDQWEDVSRGLPESAQVFQFALFRGEIFAALYAQGAYRYDASEKRWVEGAKEKPLCLVATERVLVAGRNPGGVSLSRDSGATWSDRIAGLPINAPTWAMVRAGATVLIGTSGIAGLMRSDDDGKYWAPSDRGLPPEAEAIAFGVGPSSILAMVISPAGAHRFPKLLPSFPDQF